MIGQEIFKTASFDILHNENQLVFIHKNIMKPNNFLVVKVLKHLRFLVELIWMACSLNVELTNDFDSNLFLSHWVLSLVNHSIPSLSYFL